MKLETLTLRQFRNLHDVSLSFSDHINVFYGDNGQGKTNLIESIVFLSLARSFRVRNDQALIENGRSFARITSTLKTKSKNYDLVAVVSDEGKYFEVNKTSIPLLSEFIGYCNVVLFSPDDLNLFTASPSVRRREFDYELGKISPDYLKQLNRAQHLLRERNSYLKEDVIDEVYLELLTKKLIEVSAKIIETRRTFIEALNPYLAYYFEKISHMPEEITMQYDSCIDLSNDDYVNALEELFSSSLARDRKFGLTHRGFHREDVLFLMHDQPVSELASQGQRRLIVLAYKLALTNLIKDRTKEYPILCLDDLFSELDEKRRYQVLQALPSTMQVFISTTDLTFLDSKKSLNVFKIENGKVYQGG